MTLNRRFQRELASAVVSLASASMIVNAADVTNVVVLTSKPLTLGKRPVSLKLATPAPVAGGFATVCFALRDGVQQLQPNRLVEAFQDAMHGVEIRVTAIFEDGQRIDFAEPAPGWSQSGVIMRDNELSACASGQDIPKGTRLKTIEVTSNPAFSVRGAYLRSFDPSKLDNKKPPPRP